MLWVHFSYIGQEMFNMTPHGKDLTEDLRNRRVAPHKDGLGYKKIGNILKLRYSSMGSLGSTKVNSSSYPEVGLKKPQTACMLPEFLLG